MRQFEVRPVKYNGTAERPYEIVCINPDAFDSAFVPMSKQDLAELAKEIINIISKP